MSDALLKPCPFCGSEAELTFQHSIAMRTKAMVRCKKCEAQMVYEQSIHWCADDKVIEAWNRRVDDE